MVAKERVGGIHGLKKEVVYGKGGLEERRKKELAVRVN